MAFDSYPRPPAGPLILHRGVPSAPIEFGERLSVDPETGRLSMFLALVKLGSPDATDPVIELKVDDGPPTVVGTNTPILDEAGAPEPAAIATLTASNGLYEIEFEVVRAGRTWAVRIGHGGPADTYEFTWVVADDKAQARQPWLDVTPALAFDTEPGERQTKQVSLLNKGTGPLTLTDADGTELRDGFVLDGIDARTVAPHGGTVARVTFTAPPTPGTRETEYTVGSNDAAAGAGAGHNGIVRLVATTIRKPLLRPGDIVVLSTDPDGERGTLVRVDPSNGEPKRLGADGALMRPMRIAVEPSGHVVIVCAPTSPGRPAVMRLDRFSGRLTTLTTEELNRPQGIAVAADGTIVVSLFRAESAHRMGLASIDPVTGRRTMILFEATTVMVNPVGLAVEADGNIVGADIAAFSGKGGVIRVDPATGTPTKVASGGLLENQVDVAVEADGSILVADNGAQHNGGAIVRVNPVDGTQRSVSSGQLFSQLRTSPRTFGVDVEADGHIVVSDQGSRGAQVIRVDPRNGVQALIASGPALGTLGGIAVVPAHLPDA